MHGAHPVLAGEGGMVLMSQTSYEALPMAQLKSFGLLMNMGDYVFCKVSSETC